jgi:hypothetical protein
MKRDVFISIVALVHGVYLMLSGAWPLVDMRSFELVTGPRADHMATRAVAGMSVALGLALLWCVRRGVVEAPLRFVAAGSSGTLGLVMLATILPHAADTIQISLGAMHMMLALCWAGILLTADSPYRPRPVMSARRMRQRT